MDSTYVAPVTRHSLGLNGVSKAFASKDAVDDEFTKLETALDMTKMYFTAEISYIITTTHNKTRKLTNTEK